MSKIEVKITENKRYYCKEIDKKSSSELIKKYHYSHKATNNLSTLCFGIFRKDNNKLVGTLAYGKCLNCKKTPQKIAENSNEYEMLELNRMAMLDEEPKFCESQAISLTIKYIKRFMPEIKWLLSYSDGKENNIGIIYQATNWDYLGYFKSSSFYKVDDRTMHRATIYTVYQRDRNDKRYEVDILCDMFNHVSRLYCKQFIYVYSLSDGVKYNFEKQNYPKKETEQMLFKEIIHKKEGVKLYPNSTTITY